MAGAANQEMPRNAGWRVENGYIYKDWTDVLSEPMDVDALGWKLVVPEEFKECPLRETLCLPLSWHLGIEKAADWIGREYNWKGSYQDVADYVSSCEL